MLKRNGWDNDEVINILEGCKIHIEDRHREDEHFYALEARNAGIDQAIYQFYDFKADPEESFSAMAYDPLLKQIFVISPPMPQTEDEYQEYVKKQEERNKSVAGS
jgi:hypothetical protein